MTVETLSMVVGTRAAARLEALKSKLGDTNDERAAEQTGEPLAVTVVRQATDDTSDFLTLSCGHVQVEPHNDEIWPPDGLTLIGAITSCKKAH